MLLQLGNSAIALPPGWVMRETACSHDMSNANAQ
uniref:Uncharacterized protein n=1 Tax=Picea glauca TaxID=3330 RepID=A0A101M2B0_PICGL|nr:hypothetical protein ABT39_MTgene2832 [Picea glauca]